MRQHAFRVDALEEIGRHPLRLQLRLVEIQDPDTQGQIALDQLRAPRGFLPLAFTSGARKGSWASGLAEQDQANREVPASDPIRARQAVSTCCQAQTFSTPGEG